MLTKETEPLYTVKAGARVGEYFVLRSTSTHAFVVATVHFSNDPGRARQMAEEKCDLLNKAPDSRHAGHRNR